MAAGDTIPGRLRVVNKSEHGSPVVFGPVSSSLADRKANPEKALFINKSNAKVLSLIQPHLDSPGMSTQGEGLFRSGEVLRVEHQASSLEEAADHDADEFFIGIIDVDHNYDVGDPRRARPNELTVAQQELAADPTTDTDAWVGLFEETVPDRHTYMLAGPFMVAAVETA